MRRLTALPAVRVSLARPIPIADGADAAVGAQGTEFEEVEVSADRSPGPRGIACGTIVLGERAEERPPEPQGHLDPKVPQVQRPLPRARVVVTLPGVVTLPAWRCSRLRGTTRAASSSSLWGASASTAELARPRSPVAASPRWPRVAEASASMSAPWRRGEELVQSSPGAEDTPLSAAELRLAGRGRGWLLAGLLLGAVAAAVGAAFGAGLLDRELLGSFSLLNLVGS